MTTLLSKVYVLIPLTLSLLTRYLECLLGIASDLCWLRLSFETEMAFSSWVTHLLLPDIAPNDLELISKMKSAVKEL